MRGGLQTSDGGKPGGGHNRDEREQLARGSVGVNRAKNKSRAPQNRAAAEQESSLGVVLRGTGAL